MQLFDDLEMFCNQRRRHSTIALIAEMRLPTKTFAGCDTFLGKPVRPDELLDRVRAAFARTRNGEPGGVAAWA
jgi:DNA-binding response OmpR family regulator